MFVFLFPFFSLSAISLGVEWLRTCPAFALYGYLNFVRCAHPSLYHVDLNHLMDPSVCAHPSLCHVMSESFVYVYILSLLEGMSTKFNYR